MRKQATIGLFSAVVAVVVLGAGQALAVLITPNDDTYIDESSTTEKGRPHDYPAAAGVTTGIYLKGASGSRRAGFMEYTIPDVTVTNATFNATYFRNQVADGTGAWNFQLAGSTTPASFDETTLTWTNANAAGGINSSSYTYNQTGIVGGLVALPTGNSGDGKDVTPNVPVSIDITDYFNAHKGQTIVFKMTCASTNSSAGGSFQDRELSRTMGSGAIPAGPFISYVPEPASLGLMLLASLFVMRRRAA